MPGNMYNYIRNGKKEIRPVVVLCAGEGRRLQDLGRSIPKAMVTIHNRPAIRYVIDYWKGFAGEFIFVVGYKKEQIIDFVQAAHIGVRALFVEQESPRGIAHAIGCAEKHLRDDFIVVLGDCLCRGAFVFPDSFVQGVGVWKTPNAGSIKQSYSVEVDKNLIRKVVEKPKELTNDLCGMGCYFFNARLFEYIKKTPASSLRNEVEITDVIQRMIDSREEISPLFFNGDYLNITSAEDIAAAEKIFPR